MLHEHDGGAAPSGEDRRQSVSLVIPDSTPRAEAPPTTDQAAALSTMKVFDLALFLTVATAAVVPQHRARQDEPVSQTDNSSISRIF